MNPTPITSSTSCAICAAPLTLNAAYRVAVSLCQAPGIASFNCPQGEHFCCSLDHASQAAQICLQQHIVPETSTRLTAAEPQPAPAPESPI